MHLGVVETGLPPQLDDRAPTPEEQEGVIALPTLTGTPVPTGGATRMGSLVDLLDLLLDILLLPPLLRGPQGARKGGLVLPRMILPEVYLRSVALLLL